MDTGGKLSIAMRISGVDFAQTSMLVTICNGPANGICFGEGRPAGNCSADPTRSKPGNSFGQQIRKDS